MALIMIFFLKFKFTSFIVCKIAANKKLFTNIITNMQHAVRS